MAASATAAKCTAITSHAEAIRILKAMGHRPKIKRGQLHVFLDRYMDEQVKIRAAGISLAFMGFPRPGRAEYRVEVAN